MAKKTEKKIIIVANGFADSIVTFFANFFSSCYIVDFVKEVPPDCKAVFVLGEGSNWLIANGFETWKVYTVWVNIRIGFSDMVIVPKDPTCKNVLEEVFGEYDKYCRIPLPRPVLAEDSDNDSDATTKMKPKPKGFSLK